jgi:ATP-binding cassette, subfamily B, multidrug efflux pump
MPGSTSGSVWKKKSGREFFNMPPNDFGYLEGEHLGKPYDFGLLKKVLPYLWPWRFRWLLVMLLTLAGTALDLIPPYLTKLAIDQFILKGRIQGLEVLALLLLAALVLAYVLQYAQVVLMEQLGQRVMHALRLDLVAHLLSLPLPFYQQHPVGRLVTRATNDIENLNEMVKSLLSTLVKDILLFLGIMGVLFYLNFRLALITFTVLPIIFVAARLFSRKARDAFRDLRFWVAHLNSFVQETLSGMTLIQLLKKEASRAEDFRRVNHQTYLAGMKQIQVFALFMPLMELISAGAVALLIWYGGGQVIRETLTLGALVAFLSYIQMFFRPLRELTEKYSVLQSAMASLERIFALIEEKTEEGPDETPFQRPARVQGEIAFDQVSFAYQAEDWVLQDISFTIRPGEAVAIVGMTGGGKTTLIQLLEGFYSPQKGQIRIDGIPIQSFSKKFLRAQVGLVPQEVFLFAGDLKENILLADKAALSAGATQEKIWEEIQPLFQDFEGRKVDTLSSGERQLVAMARVLARDPAILVLDEATAHLDAQTEEKVQAVLGRLLTGRTSLVIAHRLFTLRQTSRIMVLHQGRLVEEGTHAQLMDRKGYYYRLYQLQYNEDQNGE